MMDDPTLDIPTDGEFAIEPLDWLWEPYLTRGSLAVLDGDPGVGKTFVALDLAARLTANVPWPDGRPPLGGCRVILANGDDVIEQTLLPRFLAAGGVRERVSFFGGVSRRRLFRVAEFPRDFDTLCHRMAVRRPVGLVVIDPLSAFFPSLSTAGDATVRRTLAPFTRQAAVAGTTFFFVRHVTKTLVGRSLYRGCGSIGIAAAARTVFYAGRHPDDPSRFVLSVAKSNLGPPVPSLCYRIAERPGGVGVVWEGPSDLTAEDLCLVRPASDGAVRRAERWLRDRLANGPVPAAQAEADAAAAGLGVTTLRAAKKKLGVGSRRVTRDGRAEWEWVGPETALPPLQLL